MICTAAWDTHAFSLCFTTYCRSYRRLWLPCCSWCKAKKLGNIEKWMTYMKALVVLLTISLHILGKSWSIMCGRNGLLEIEYEKGYKTPHFWLQRNKLFKCSVCGIYHAGECTKYGPRAFPGQKNIQGQHLVKLAFQMGCCLESTQYFGFPFLFQLECCVDTIWSGKHSG